MLKAYKKNQNQSLVVTNQFGSGDLIWCIQISSEYHASQYVGWCIVSAIIDQIMPSNQTDLGSAAANTAADNENNCIREFDALFANGHFIRMKLLEGSLTCYGSENSILDMYYFYKVNGI
jgi:hypothetical protein